MIIIGRRGVDTLQSPKVSPSPSFALCIFYPFLLPTAGLYLTQRHIPMQAKNKKIKNKKNEKKTHLLV